MKTNTRDNSLNYMRRRHLLPLVATMVTVFFLMPGSHLLPGTDAVTAASAACTGGNFKSFGGAPGKSKCLKRLVIPGVEGGEAPDPVSLSGSKGSHKAHKHQHRHEHKAKGHHKGKGHNKSKGHHKGKGHEPDKGKTGGKKGRNKN